MSLAAQADPPPTFPPLVRCDRLVLVTRAPGDETAAAAGLLHTAHRAGVPTTIVAISDGPGDEADRLARRRRHIDAVHEIAPASSVVFLAVPHDEIQSSRPAIAETLGALLGAGQESRILLVAPWWESSGDRRALGEIARAFATGAAHAGDADAVGATGAAVRVLGYDVDADETARHPQVLTLDAAAAAAKARAAAIHAPGRHDPRDPAPREAAPDETARAETEPQETPPEETAPEETASPETAHQETPPETEAFHEPDPLAQPSWTTENFDAFHARHDDPWGLAGRWYERRKRALLLASLPRERFRHTLELGCATGVTTRALALRSDGVVGVDSSAIGLEKAAAGGVPDNVTFARKHLPDEWPAGEFDLVVLSELAYYWTPEQFAEALDRIDTSATDDAVLLSCHWRRTKPGTPLTGDDVHAAIVARPEWSRLARHIEEDFLMDVFVRPGTPSVAAAEG